MAPVSLVTALAGLWVLGRSRIGRSLSPVTRALAAAPDVFRCIAVLCTEPLVLTYVAKPEPAARAYWLTAAIGVLVPLACWLALPPRVRPWVLLAVGLFGSTLVLADAVYDRFFGEVLSAPAILGARQSGRVWESIRTLFSAGRVWLFVDWPFAVQLTIRVSRSMAEAAGAVCYDEARRTPVDSIACQAEESVARRVHDTSRLIVLEDLQQQYVARPRTK